MPSHLERLKAALEEWLIRNDLDLDTNFYSIEDWRKREEDYHIDAELVLIYEGGLHDVLNYMGGSEEFDDYIESFGYYYELGHTWNMGFYPIPGYDFTSLKGGYRQRLQDPRWKKSLP